MDEQRKRLKGVWHSMISRATNPNNIGYKNYGGRGITVCDEWRNDFQAFYDWAITNGYKQGLTLDRRDNDGNYEPSNCRWVDRFIQANNRRNTAVLVVDGKEYAVAEWCRANNANRKEVYQRESRRKKGMVERHCYLESEHQKTLHYIELLKKTMQQFPAYSNRKLASEMNISEGYVRKLKKML